MIPRSSRREVRNPILALPEVKAIMALPVEQREALAVLLKGVARAAREKGEHCWSTRKPPMAGYWASSAVVAKHIAHALRRPA